MKKLIQKIFAQKKIGLTVIFLLLIFISLAIYTVLAISENVDKMKSVPEVTYYPKYPPLNVTGKNAVMLRRGEYLTKAGDCMACHTNKTEAEKTQIFAGGLAMQTPFGTIYSPNITPDKETGIGKWTDAQFIKAMREGISPQGHYYYPAFPYLYFNRISIEDLKAIKAYLDTIPAVHKKNRSHDMIFPFNFRILQLPWRILFFYPESSGAYQNDPHQTEQWNRGAYLVQGLGHCAMCHSPSYHILSEDISLGAPIRKYDLSGSKIQGFLAPNITKSNLDTINISEIVEVFTKDKLIGGGNVVGPMLEVNHNSLNYLTQSDLADIATYLKSVHTASRPKPTGGAVGKGIYGEFCAGCHATGGGGAPKYGDPTDWNPIAKQNIDIIYSNAIQGKGGMPAKGTCLACTDGEIKQAVDYMLEAAKGKTPVFTPQKPKPLTLDDGKRIYLANCSVCHNGGFKNAPKPGDIEAWRTIVDAGFIPTYLDVLTGQKGHPPRGACKECSDAEIKAAVKYMLQESSTTKDFSLW